jgi:hypothetical protein
MVRIGHSRTLRSTSDGALSGSSAITTASVNVLQFTEASIYIKTTAKSGTTPEINWDVETSWDGTDWHKHTDITQILDPTVTHYADVVTISNIAKFLRLKAPVGVEGTGTPTLTQQIVVHLKD